MSKQILGGIKILDLTRVLAGPWCTQALADMGATVYKIERLGAGDEMRHSPPFLKDADGAPTRDSTSYVCVNRGKRSLAIDFTRPEGRKLLLGLVERCDVLAENFKVGDLKRYGLDYESVRKVNPSIVYCSITGYGQDGPMASQPGYDPVFQAISGIMSTCGLPDGMPGSGPMRSMLPLVDVMTGMVSTSAILGALLHRKGTGEGQHLDIALLDVALAATVHLGQTYLSTGKLPQRAGNGSLLFAPSNCYPCVEGHILIQIGNDFQWTRLCKCLGKEDWLEDPRFVTNASRMTLSRELDLLLSEITRTWDKQTLSELLGKSGVPCGPVNNLAQAFEHPQVKHRELKMELEHPVYGKLAQIRSPLRFSATPAQYRIPPALGADTADVLREELGLSEEMFGQLQEAGLV
ncbi:CaiB/BaiF CoA transferase family protein [Polaromonas sp.]|uniref:CaiB/BaiF CoA transferase family protein n=1 Tax=Polaromonas sp. TaxID=1869339 RepID=UPI003BAD13D3